MDTGVCARSMLMCILYAQEDVGENGTDMSDNEPRPRQHHCHVRSFLCPPPPDSAPPPSRPKPHEQAGYCAVRWKYGLQALVSLYSAECFSICSVSDRMSNALFRTRFHSYPHPASTLKVVSNEINPCATVVVIARKYHSSTGTFIFILLCILYL